MRAARRPRREAVWGHGEDTDEHTRTTKYTRCARKHEPRRLLDLRGDHDRADGADLLLHRLAGLPDVHQPWRELRRLLHRRHLAATQWAGRCASVARWERS